MAAVASRERLEVDVIPQFQHVRCPHGPEVDARVFAVPSDQSAIEESFDHH